ncbi:DUF4136 domain-containing protein [Duncaniella muris]|uniref:DUF4136 domain-containing protein n=1 Tax=Duncaniella muris TaxID=2094150 RepID=UPI0025A95F2A|nr:DUF4136 domain-containing protein [Duncaniella muris]
MKKWFGFMVLAVMAILSSCSPYNLVTSTTYNDADLSNYSTFRIVTPDEGKLPPGMAMVTYYNIAAAIREQMVDRGFREDPASPLLINIGLTIKQQIATEPAIPPGGYPCYWGPYHGYAPWFMYPRGYYWPGYYANAQVITGVYREGVLTMDMVNIAQKVPLFSASVGTILDNGDTQFRNLQGIAEAVQTLFSKFPVPLLPQYR